MSVHHYFHIAEVTDLAVIRDQANVRTKENNKYGTPTDSVVHLHKHEAECVGQLHEFYAVTDTQKLTEAFWKAILEETVR